MRSNIPCIHIPPRYFATMVMDTIRRTFMLLMLGVFGIAVVRAQLPVLNPGVAGVMMTAQGLTGDDEAMADMPCKGVVPGCYTALGCMFLVALPPMFLPNVARLHWGDVSYWAVSGGHIGRNLVPALGPPIRLA